MTTNPRTRLPGLLGTALIVVMVALSTSPPARAATETGEVGSAAEAWYLTPSQVACSAPIGCPPGPEELSPYPEGTLHVGVGGGQGTAHAYLEPDLSGLPLGARLVEATLTMPVSQDPQAGNAQPESATLVACLVTEPITDGVEGGTGDAPAYDCERAQSPGHVAEDTTSFTFDLAPIVDAWSSGATENGVALVAAQEQEPGASWHVAFTGKDSDAEPTPTTQLVYDLPPVADRRPGDQPSPTAPAPSSERMSPPATVSPAPSVAAPARPEPRVPSRSLAPMSAAPEVAPPAPVATPDPAPAASPARFTLRHLPWDSHDGVVYLPLVLVVGVAAVGHALTRPMEPRALRSSAPVPWTRRRS